MAPPALRGPSAPPASRRCSWVAAVAILTLPAAAAHGQDASPAAEPAATAVPSASDGPQFLMSVEARRDRFRYHFDNPSSADTPFFVPHFFEQQYVADNVWLVATGRYTASVRWETSLGAAPERAVRGDDYDTFFDPGDVVIVSGTTGDAFMRSFLISQRADIGRAGPIQLSLGYRLRWDRFDFQLGHKTVTRNGVLIAASEETSREMTDSQVHEVLVGFSAASPLGGVWRLAVSGEVSPATVARLSVQLPDKYPGQDLVFVANVVAASARVALVRAGERWPLDIAMLVEHTWSYRSTAQLSRSAQSVALRVGRTW
jgi:hypothetical protein